MHYPEDPSADGAPPRYPGADYYQNLADQAKQQQATYQPIAQKYAENPYMPPVQPRQRMRTHNAFTRFVVAWGGMNRLLLSLGSAAVSVIAYYALWFPSWTFAAGLVASICIHELGHAFALRVKHMRATFPIFIPLMGAFVTLPNTPISMRDQADISLAGPFLGGVAALVCFIMSIVFVQYTPGYVSIEPIWLLLAHFGFLINLINLVPMLPLDGGHIASTLSRWLPAVGLGILVVLFFWPATPFYHSYFLLLIGFLGINDVMRSLNGTGRIMVMRTADRVTVAVMYGGLALLLFAGFIASSDDTILHTLLRWRTGYGN